MREYKGVIKINCNGKYCPEHRANVNPSCLECVHSDAKVVDLEDKVIAKYKARKSEIASVSNDETEPEPVSAKQKSKKK